MDDITIEDCYYYHSASITYNNSSTDVYPALCTGVESIMTNNFSLEFQIRNNSGTGGVLNVGATTQYSPTGNSANYRMSIGIDSGSTNFNNRTNTSSATTGMSINNGTWYTLKMVKYEELYRAYNEGTLFSTKTPTWISTYPNYDLYFIGWSNCNMDVKEIKLKVIP